MWKCHETLGTGRRITCKHRTGKDESKAKETRPTFYMEAGIRNMINGAIPFGEEQIVNT